MRKIIPVLFLIFWLTSSVSAQVTFTPESVDVPCNATSYCIEIEVTNFDSILGMQYSLNWDTAAMTLTSYSDFLPSTVEYDTSTILAGEIGISWQNFNSVTLADGDSLFQLCFTPNGSMPGTVFLDQPLNGGNVEVSGFSNGALVQFLPFQFDTGTISYDDIIDPMISCPNDTIVMAIGVVNDIDFTNLSDDCGVPSVTYDLEMNSMSVGSGNGSASGQSFASGVTTVTYTASDGAGNNSSCSFTVTVDAVPPPPQDTFLQFIPEIIFDCENNQATVEIKVVDFLDINSMQFGIFWDTLNAQWSSTNFQLTNSNLFPNPPDTAVYFTWTSGASSSLSLPDSAVILSFTFDITGSLNLPLITFGDFSQFAFVEITGENVNGPYVEGTHFEFTQNYLVEVIDSTPPTLSNCPTDTTIFVSANMCTASVNYAMPNVSDACDPNPTVSCSPAPGLLLPLGVNPVTCTATDVGGNTDSCSFNITVIDTIAPVIVCPNDTIVSTDPDKCSALVDGLAPVSVSDNCTPNPQIEWVVQPSGMNGFFDVSSTQSMVSFLLGVNTITYTATDAANNTGNCIFTVTVQDLDPPTIACTADTTFNTGFTSCNVTATIPAPAIDDNCGLDSLTYTIGGVTTTLPMTATDFTQNFSVGTTTVTFTIVDQGGLTATCDFDVTVVDNGGPVIDCPATVNVNSGPGSCEASATVPAPTISDNCGIDSLTYTIGGITTILPLGNISFTSTFSLGTTTVTYIVYDQNGNSATCDVDVVVSDNTAPALECPNDTTLTITSGANVVVGDIALVASDPCGTIGVSYALSGATSTPGPSATDASGTAFNTGTTTVTYYADDGNGNLDSCSFFVNVTGGQLDIDCPMAQSESSDAMTCGQVLMDLELMINSDPTHVTSINYTLTGATMGGDTLDASGAFFEVGVTTVTYFVEDVFGNMVQCAFSVTITDDTPPMITCPTVDAFPSDDGQCFATISSAFLAPPISGLFDNCGIDSVGFTLTGDNTGSGPLASLPTIFVIGTSQLTYTIIDINGLSSSCTIEVVVNDSEAPVINCPNDTIIIVPAGTIDTMINDLGITFSDLCGEVNSVLFTTTSGLSDTLDASGSSFPVGNTTVTYNVTDDAGNLTTCTFNIAIVEDGAPDCIECPEDVISCNSSVTGIAPIIVCDPNDIQSLSWNTTGASGVFSGLGDISSDVSGFLFSPGTTFVTYTSVDNNNFVDECPFIVQVDDIAPMITGCPTVPIVVEAAPDQCSASASWTEPTAADLCGLESFTSNTVPFQTFPLGDTTVTYMAVDSAGNMATCSFIVSILDVTGPVFDFCPPSNIVYDQQPGTCDAIVTWDEPMAVDECSDVMISSSHDSGDVFTGTTTVVYVATDDSGNTSTCSFDIVAGDNSNPVIEDCPNDAVLVADTDLCAAVFDFTPPTATDDCSSVSIVCTHMSGDTFDIGVTTVVCIAIDAVGNDTSCTFTVTVMDVDAPSFNFCPDNILVLNTDMGECGATVFWPSPSAIDDCDTSVMLTSNFEPGDFFPVGDTTVVYTATDASGNTSTCEFIVTVEDNENPVINCLSDVIVDLGGNIISDPDGVVIDLTATAGCDSINIFFMAPEVEENCPGFSVTHTGPSSGMAFELGTTVLTYEVTDMSGNSSTCQFSFEVQALPGINIVAVPGTNVCEGTTVQLTIDSTAAIYEWTGPGGFTSSEQSPVIPEVSGNYAVVCTPPSGCTTTGNIDITYSASPIFDAFANSPICNENIELNLTIDPTSPAVDSFFWEYPDGTITMVEDPIIINPDQSDGGIYTITLFSGLCSVSEDITVEVIGNFTTPPQLFSDCDGAVCVGETCTIIGTSYPEGVFYNWTATPADCLPAVTNSNTIEVTPTAIGNCVFTYWVVQDGCVSDTVSIALSVSGPPAAEEDEFDTEIETPALNLAVLANDDYNPTLGTGVTIVTEPINGELTSNGDGTFNYTPNDGFSGTDQFIYQICHSCTMASCDMAIATIHVIDESCTVPNIITPNGDGMNEELRINCLNSGDFQEASLQILNEWGDEVYFNPSYDNSWRGTWEGKELPDGTYFYIFQLEPDATIDKGYITIFR